MCKKSTQNDKFCYVNKIGEVCEGNEKNSDKKLSFGLTRVWTHDLAFTSQNIANWAAHAACHMDASNW